MANKLDLSLDEIIVREKIGINGPKRVQNNKTDLKREMGFKKITIELNNKMDSNEDNEHKQSNKRKSNESIDEIMGSKRANYMTNSNNVMNRSSHFDDNCGQIFVNNLKYEVTDDDVQQLFGAFGPLKRAAVNYSNSGRSAGSAFIVFERKCDAITAFGSLKNITLDGRALQLSIVNNNNRNESLADSMSSGEQRMARRVGNLTNRISSSSLSSESSSTSGRNVWNDIAKTYDSTFGSNEPKRNSYRNQKSNNCDESDSTKKKFNVEDLDADLEDYIARRNITK